MEKSRNFQTIYAGHTNLSKQINWPHERHYETGDSPAATLSQWGQASSHKQSKCGRHDLSNILKLQATFLYSIYHQRAGKTNLFHMRGGRFHAGIHLLRVHLSGILVHLKKNCIVNYIVTDRWRTVIGRSPKSETFPNYNSQNYSTLAADKPPEYIINCASPCSNPVYVALGWQDTCPDPGLITL